MKILITGGYGFLGRHLTEALLEAGHELILTSRKEREELRTRAQWQRLDLSDFQTIFQLPGVTAIVHAGALIPRRSGETFDLQDLWSVNALGTLRLVTWAQDHGVEKFVYCSSMSVYARDEPLPVAEGARTYPAGPSSAYGLSKLAGEVFAESFRQERGGNIFSLRFSTLYGEGMERGEVLPIFVARALAGEPLQVNAPEASGDFLYVKDAAAAVRAALGSKHPGGVFNIGSGVETTLADLAETIRETVPAPAKAEIQTHRGGKGRRFCMDISKARRELGFQPRFNLRTGLADWLQNEEARSRLGSPAAHDTGQSPRP